MSVYKTLLRIAVEHNYIANGVCSCLDFKPTEKTRVILKNAGLLCKSSTDGVQIVFDENKLEVLEMYARDQQDLLSFDFKVYSSDPEFRSYTEPDANAPAGILYLDNLLTSGSGQQSLSVSDHVSAQDIKAFDSSELSGLLSPRDRLLPPLLVLRIFARKDGDSLLEHWLDPEPTIYSIRFSSRQRYWKYYLLGKLIQHEDSGNRYHVIDPDNQIEFEPTGEEILSDRRLAYTFRSKQPIPLYEYYPFRFQLIENKRNDRAVLIDRLPVADVSQIGIDTVNKVPAVVSEIYINS